MKLRAWMTGVLARYGLRWDTVLDGSSLITHYGCWCLSWCVVKAGLMLRSRLHRSSSLPLGQAGDSCAVGQRQGNFCPVWSRRSSCYDTGGCAQEKEGGSGARTV